MTEPSEHFGADRGDPVPEFDPIARHYILLPHERWSARRYFGHWYSPEHRNSATTRENGPVAMVLRGAFRAWVIPGWLILMAGLLLLVAGGGPPLSFWLGGVGMVFILVGMVRLLPALSATRRYQAGRAGGVGGSGRPGAPPPTPSPGGPGGF